MRPTFLMATTLLVLASAVLATLLLRTAPATPGDFEPPGPAARIAAIGDTGELSPVLRRAFDPATHFEAIPKPGPSDWLANHEESGQTFDDFATAPRNEPDGRRSKLYVQPLGAFEADRSPSLPTLEALAGAFFGLEVSVPPARPLDGAKITERINPHTEKKQLLTRDILDLLKADTPEDAFCVLAVTMEDLYPDPSWNYVFGEASLRERAGVFSFARYDPTFFGGRRGEDYRIVLLRRSLSVVVHETGHMFGIHHCIYFRCVMNGSNNLAESDSREVHLCPMCLRKLHEAIDFDVATRYEKLARAYAEHGLEREARWVEARLAFVRGKPTAPDGD